MVGAVWVGVGVEVGVGVGGVACCFFAYLAYLIRHDAVYLIIQSNITSRL